MKIFSPRVCCDANQIGSPFSKPPADFPQTAGGAAAFERKVHSARPDELCEKRIEISKADYGAWLSQLFAQEVGCGRAVRGRNIAKGGQANQALDIGSVRVDIKGIDEEEQHIQFTTRNQRTDFLIATEGAGF